MVILLGLVIGSMTLYVHALNQNSSTAQRNEATRAALAEAKQILIAWSAEFASSGPGHLPCPDLDGDGDGEGAACGGTSTRIGRFPWKTLTAPDLRDASGESLWYAVSGNFVNRPENAINSDTAGAFTVSGDTGASKVIAIIFAPGPALNHQDRSSAGAKNNRANYLEDDNFDDDIFVSQSADDSSNDQIALITAADLFPAVERKVATMLETVFPVLNHYSEKWFEAEGVQRMPFAAPFAPAGADSASCNGGGSWRGQFPARNCTDWTVAWDKSSGTCVSAHDRTPAANRPFTLPPDSMTAIKCEVTVIAGSSSDGDDEEDDESPSTKKVKFTATLRHGAMTLALPVAKSSVLHALKQPKSFSIISKRQINGDVLITYEASFDTAGLTTITLPVFSANTQYTASLSEEEKEKRDPSWYFRNEWHRVTYYAMAPQRLPGATICSTERFKVEDETPQLKEHEALMILAGHGLQGAERPSGNLSHYLEQKNADASSKVFQQSMLSRQFNDRIVPITGMASICP